MVLLVLGGYTSVATADQHESAALQGLKRIFESDSGISISAEEAESVVALMTDEEKTKYNHRVRFEVNLRKCEGSWREDPVVYKNMLHVLNAIMGENKVDDEIVYGETIDYSIVPSLPEHCIPIFENFSIIIKRNCYMESTCGFDFRYINTSDDPVVAWKGTLVVKDVFGDIKIQQGVSFSEIEEESKHRWYSLRTMFDREALDAIQFLKKTKTLYTPSITDITVIRVSELPVAVRESYAERLAEIEKDEKKSYAPTGVGFAYRTRLRVKLTGFTLYPKAVAEEHGVGGRVWIGFVIGQDGSLLSTEVKESSGHEVLDRAVEQMIEMAQPFEPLPNGVEKANFAFPITLVLE